MASVSSRASTSRNASRAAVKSPASNFSRPMRRLSATRRLPSAISWRAFSMRPTASLLLMSIRKIRDQTSMACWRLPLRAASSPRASSPSISCWGDGGSGSGSGAPMLKADGYPSGVGAASGSGSAGASLHMPDGPEANPEGASATGNSSSDSGPAGGRPPKSGGRTAAGLSSGSSSESESRLRLPRPPSSGLPGDASSKERPFAAAPGSSSRTAKPGLVDSPTSFGESAASRLSSRATDGWSGSIDRIFSRAARASAG